MDISLFLQLSILGILVGFAAGLLGVGGGGILVPILTGIYLTQNIAPEHAVHLALGTSMACIITTTFSSAFSHYKKHNVDWVYVQALVPFIIVGSLAVSFAIPYFNGEFLALFFAFFMLFMAYKMVTRQSQDGVQAQQKGLPTNVAGFGIGGVSTLVAIGGGVLIVPYLTSKGLTIRRAIGSSSAVGVAIALTGTLGYAINGQMAAGKVINQAYVLGFVHLPTVLVVSLYGFFMAPLGAKLSNSLPLDVLKKLFALLLICLSVKMLLMIYSG